MTRIEPKGTVLQFIGKHRRQVSVFKRVCKQIQGAGKVVYLPAARPSRPKLEVPRKSGLRAWAESFFRRAA